MTALAWTLEYGCADVARLLLENGATMDFEDKVRRTDRILCPKQLSYPVGLETISS